jgi:hypothetical protein
MDITLQKAHDKKVTGDAKEFENGLFLQRYML